MEGRLINHFTDLIAWQKSHEFVKSVYIITKNFPGDEKFGLIDQLRRAASSITANIAEGYGRFHFKYKIKFYYQSRGSNTECQNHIILAYDLQYIDNKQFVELKRQSWESFKLISGLIASTEKQNQIK